METATTAGAGVAITSPLWLQTINPYVQFVVACMGGIWIAVQLYYKIKNERKARREDAE
ncbi:hypothetical protein [Tardiphaga sp. 367_B4_N1_1]|jgi:hypothetical protein|uniref:hypothetical protein n=1 Tax=Tardiphaga sp. 367_B4_N1_1 TaxID=3240777 RepID=UPI003F1F8E1D